jgi:hypothetical protein
LLDLFKTLAHFLEHPTTCVGIGFCQHLHNHLRSSAGFFNSEGDCMLENFVKMNTQSPSGGDLYVNYLEDKVAIVFKSYTKVFFKRREDSPQEHFPFCYENYIEIPHKLS